MVQLLSGKAGTCWRQQQLLGMLHLLQGGYLEGHCLPNQHEVHRSLWCIPKLPPQREGTMPLEFMSDGIKQIFCNLQKWYMAQCLVEPRSWQYGQRLLELFPCLHQPVGSRTKHIHFLEAHFVHIISFNLIINIECVMPIPSEETG